MVSKVEATTVNDTTISTETKPEDLVESAEKNTKTET